MESTEVSLSPPRPEKNQESMSVWGDSRLGGDVRPEASAMRDRKWAETLLIGENRVLEMIARGTPLGPILDAVCRLVEELSDGCLCSILSLDLDGHHLRHGAAPSLPRTYIDAIDGKAIGTGWGRCGIAAYRKEPVIAADVGADVLCAEYRDLALAHGLRAYWSTPIRSSAGQVLGTFAIYSREPGNPTPQHRTLIGQITHLAAVAIEGARAEERLRRSETYLADAQRLSHAGSDSWRSSS